MNDGIFNSPPCIVVIAAGQISGVGKGETESIFILKTITEQFTTLSNDGSKSLSIEGADAAFPKLAQVGFDNLDSDGDNGLSIDKFHDSVEDNREGIGEPEIGGCFQSGKYGNTLKDFLGDLFLLATTLIVCPGLAPRP